MTDEQPDGSATAMAPTLDHTGNPPRLALRPKDAAKALGIGERLLWSITADKTSGIPHCRFGTCIVYPVRELADWLAERVRAGSDAT